MGSDERDERGWGAGLKTISVVDKLDFSSCAYARARAEKKLPITDDNADE